MQASSKSGIGLLILSTIATLVVVVFVVTGGSELGQTQWDNWGAAVESNGVGTSANAPPVDELLAWPDAQSGSVARSAAVALSRWDIDEAISILEPLVKDTGIPRDVEYGRKALLAQAYLSYGSERFKEHEYAKKAEELVSGFPDTPYGLYFIGYSREIVRDFSGALAYYGSGELLIPEHKKYLRSVFKAQIGHVYDLAGDPASAFGYYAQAHELDPTNANASVQLSRSFTRKGDFKRALPFLDHALSHATNRLIVSNIHTNYSSLVLFRDATTGRDVTETVADMVRHGDLAVRADPNNPRAYVSRSYGYFFQKEFEKAHADLKKALEIHPSLAVAHERMWFLWLVLWENGKATASFNEAVRVLPLDVTVMRNEIEPTAARIRVNLGYAQLASGLSVGTETIRKACESPYASAKAEFRRQYDSGVYSKTSFKEEVDELAASCGVSVKNK